MRKLDFTLQKYKELCEAILKEYTPLTIESYLMKKPSGKLVILRHDVDRKPETALRMAKMEKYLGITSTYYFRMKNDTKNWIKQRQILYRGKLRCISSYRKQTKGE